VWLTSELLTFKKLPFCLSQFPVLLIFARTCKHYQILKLCVTGKEAATSAKRIVA